MTPKAKAEDLYYRCPIVELGDDDGIVKNDLSMEALKDVLIFLVDEIIKSNNENWVTPTAYWEDVKEEIENL